MMRSRIGSRLVFMVVFLVIYSLVRGAMGPDNRAAAFVAPVVAGVVTVAISYWIRARMVRE